MVFASMVQRLDLDKLKCFNTLIVAQQQGLKLKTILCHPESNFR